jgi:hypothetical protein
MVLKCGNCIKNEVRSAMSAGSANEMSLGFKSTSKDLG